MRKYSKSEYLVPIDEIPEFGKINLLDRNATESFLLLLTCKGVIKRKGIDIRKIRATLTRINLTNFRHRFHFYTLENVGKPVIFSCFQGVYRKGILA